jgi:hypothetical protein
VSRARHDLVILVLTVTGGSMVAAADFSRSYVPLFFGWVAFAAIPWVLSRMERGGEERDRPS